MPLGLYISVPFCRTKCTFCNFASDVFSKSSYENYVLRLIEDITHSHHLAAQLGCPLGATTVDSIYLGGGTPSILDGAQLRRIFGAVQQEFVVDFDAEITVECAPGTLTPTLMETLLECGVNRVSLGVQSFVDREAQSVGRLHSRSVVLDDIQRLRAVGLTNINLDLIAGLPHQTAESWAFSLSETIATDVPHVSVYMLEVDDDSRLGRELIAGGARYHAHFVPNEDATADFYEQACVTLPNAGIAQYEISNFAKLETKSTRASHTDIAWAKSVDNNQSRHNLKYWTRQPYMGFGVDAHSMLELRMTDSATPNAECLAVRFATPESLDAYMNGASSTVTAISAAAAIEESLFLGLRLNCGVDLDRIFPQGRLNPTSPNMNCDPERSEGSVVDVQGWRSAIDRSLEEGLLERQGSILRLTARGRLLSNEVFARFLMEENKQKKTRQTKTKWEPVT